MNAEIKFKTRNAWLCAVLLIVLDFCFAVGVLTAEKLPFSEDWFKEHLYYAEAVFEIFQAILWLIIVYLFASVNSVKNFVKSIGLAYPINLSIFVIFATIVIGFLDNYGAIHKWTSTNPIGAGFYEAGKWWKFFYIMFAISIGPFFEEVTMRGFLYPAFRTNYGGFVSTIIVCCIEAYFHHAAVLGSFYTAICYGLLWVLLCIVREKRISLWNCILCHATYNAVTLRQWPICIAIILIFLFWKWSSQMRDLRPSKRF